MSFEKKETWMLANATGMSTARGLWIALCNPDIYFTNGSLHSLLQHLKLIRRPTIIGCRLLSENGGDINPMRSLNLQYIFFVSSHRMIGTWIDRKILRRFFEKRFIVPVHNTCTVGHINASFMAFPKSLMHLWNIKYRWAVADSDFVRRASSVGIDQILLYEVKLYHEGEYSKKRSSRPLYDFEYAFGYSLYAKTWGIHGLHFLFTLDAIFAPVLSALAGQDSIFNQIKCSAAKIQGLLR